MQRLVALLVYDIASFVLLQKRKKIDRSGIDLVNPLKQWYALDEIEVLQLFFDFHVPECVNEIISHQIG